jgi:hypothetical protein
VEGNGVVIAKYKGQDGDVVIPAAIGWKNVTRIDCLGFFLVLEGGTFQDCRALPPSLDGVTGIDGWVFASSYNLTSITIPDSVSSVGKSAFFYCYKLNQAARTDIERRFGKEVFEYTHI